MTTSECPVHKSPVLLPFEDQDNPENMPCVAKRLWDAFGWMDLPEELHPYMIKVCTWKECDHEWVDPRNKIIESGRWCIKCNMIAASE